MGRFAIGAEDFLLDGAPFRVLSGAIHYFRVHPDLWADRIEKARLMGLNTIETYVAWNAHEPRRGEWRDSDELDLGRFLDLVAEAGMLAIVRPGPYICAEWHNGGLPVWLTSIPGARLRTSDPLYLTEVERYLDRVYETVAPRQIDRGGPVVLVQIENEYGAYGDDKAYLERLVEVTRGTGITVPLITVDQPQPEMLAAGTLPDLHTTGSFGSRAAEKLAVLREHQPTGPLMCSEFWDGWFDWWGGVHHTVDPDTVAAELDALLAAGASVNVYMFHGGTNFGLTNGANHKGRYLPIVTSYDYGAPLDETGNPTELFHALRAVIERYAEVPAALPAVAGPAPVASGILDSAGPLVVTGGSATRHETPPTFEQLDHIGALVRYEVELADDAFERPDGTCSALVLDVGEVRDIAWVELDGEPIGRLSRVQSETTLAVPRAGRLSVLVAELGRVDYGPRLGETKGLIGPVRLGGRELLGWEATPLDVAALAAAPLRQLPASAPAAHPGPAVLRGSLILDAPADLYLATAHWGMGIAIVNGFVLGRYWSTGPQCTLVVPAPVTRAGENEVVVIELQSLADRRIETVAAPSLGPIEE